MSETRVPAELCRAVAEHFAWGEDFTRILGLTPTGRATVVELHLNRPGLVNLRRAVRALGEHPPPESNES